MSGSASITVWADDEGRVYACTCGGVIVREPGHIPVPAPYGYDVAPWGRCSRCRLAWAVLAGEEPGDGSVLVQREPE